ncbi:hypothetical protein BH09PSE5_BH09PSE5_33540 [soil metagenome]
MSATPNSPSRPRFRFGLPPRFDTLRVKLFLAIAGANALLAIIAFAVFSWSFDQGFVEYVNRADENRLQPLVTRLAESFKKEGSWEWIAQDRRRWGELMREVFGIARSNRRAEDGGPPSSASQIDPAMRVAPPATAVAPPTPPTAFTPGPAAAPANIASSAPPAGPGPFAGRGPDGGPPRDGPPLGQQVDQLLTIDPRLMLFDGAQKLISGRPEMVPEAVMKPITVDGTVVGYLGYVPRLKVVTSLERLFSAQQTAKFAAIGIGMLIAGLLIGALLANWLSLRIRRLAQGAEALIQGRYEMRIDSQGNDELARLAKDFNQLAQTLEAAQRARQQWIADIAHELRTPLAVLRAEIEALQDGVRPLGQQSLGSLAQEVTQLTRLVEDLRLLSLSDLGALTYHKEPLDLGEVIADCIGAQALALEERGLDVESQLPDGVRVLGDGARLAQVFGNLLQNTVRYTGENGRLAVALTVTGGSDVAKAATQAVVVWEDSSPGVGADDLPRLTERLFRIDSSRSRAGGGSGLGLAITKAIVEAHGGSMHASTSQLGGVRWQIEFPIFESTDQPVLTAPRHMTDAELSARERMAPPATPKTSSPARSFEEQR